jgi:hypothetical protein
MMASMKTISVFACSFLVAMFSGIVSSETQDQSASLVEQAISQDQVVARQAQDQLRATGPRGLRLLEQRFAREIAAHRKGAPTDEHWKRIGAALDHVSGQYDDYSSGLFWYTDLEKAKAAAQSSGKPILSLRLLGRLDEDLSCANSRFFRTTLYPNAEISALLKDRFILHWESVRPAPRVTIDFGDGRTLERTITGNSIHYVLDQNGVVVDALPGLYSAQVFATELNLAAAAASASPKDYAAHRKATQTRLLKAWADDLVTIHVKLSLSQTPPGQELERLTNDSAWQQISRLHTDAVAFDAGTREVMARKFPDAGTAARIAVAKSMAETPMMRAFRNLQNTVSLDTVRNNYLLRTKILAFLNDPYGKSLSLRDINDWAYAEVFLTPNEDPWLGLAPNDVFAAIDKNGQSQ